MNANIGRIINVADATVREGLQGHPGMTAHRFVAPGSGTRHLLVTLNVVEEGGGIEPHYHENLDADHAYFLFDGTAVVRIGDDEFEAGPRSLIVFPPDVVHGFRVTSPGTTHVLRLGGSNGGPATGGSVFV